MKQHFLENRQDRFAGPIFKTTFLLFVAAVCTLAQWPAFGETPLYASTHVLASTSMAFVGVMLWQLQNMRLLAIGSIVGGLLWSFQWLTVWNENALPLLGVNANMLFYSVLGPAFVLSPSGKRHSLFEKSLVFAFVLIGLVQIVVLPLSLPEWNGFSRGVWWSGPWSISRHHFDLYLRISGLGWGVIALLFVSIIVRRVRALRGHNRLIVAPIICGLSVFSAICGVASSVQPLPTAHESRLFFYLSLAILLIPTGFIVAGVRRALSTALLMRRLNTGLSSTIATPERVREQLRETLSDPALEIYFSDQEEANPDTRVPDGHGFTAELRTASGKRSATVVGSEPVFDMQILETILAASAVAVENASLYADLQSQLRELEESRRRLIEEVSDERRKVIRALEVQIGSRLQSLHVEIIKMIADGGREHSAELIQISSDLAQAIQALRRGHIAAPQRLS